MSAVSTDVAAFEHGRLRLYALDADVADAAELVAALRDDPRRDEELRAALGTDRADAYWADLVDLRDIAEMGLVGYLRRAYEVPEGQIDADALRTDARYVLIVPSRCLGDDPQTLSPQPWLTPLAEFDVAKDPGSLRPMEPAEVSPRSQPPTADDERPQPDARRGLGGRAILVLLLIAAAFVAIVAL